MKIHCSILAEDAIKAAVSDYKARSTARAARDADAKASRLTWRSPSPKRPPRHVTRYLGKRGKGVGVRLGVKTTGCSGLAYKLEYADESRPRTIVFEDHGVKVLVDPKSLAYIDGTRARLRARGPERGLQVQQPEREGPLRLRRVVPRLSARAGSRRAR